MSTKTSTQPSRRTPLSLSGATSKQQQQQQQQQQSSTNSRNENKPATSNQKTEQTATTASMQKDNKTNIKQQNIVDKKIQQQNTKVASNNATSSGSVKKPERSDEKKPQNGVGNENSNNGNAKEKQQNGKEASANDNSKDKKESKTEKVEKNEKPTVGNNDKKEKLEKEKEKKKEQDKEKEKEMEIEKAKILEKEKAELLKKEKEELAKKEKEALTKKEKEEFASKEKEEALQKEQEKLLAKEKEKIIKDNENKPEKEPRAKRSTALETIEKKQHQDDKAQLAEDDVEQMDISVNDEKSFIPATPTRRSGVHKFETPRKQEEKPLSPELQNKTTPRSPTPSSNQSSTSLTCTTKVRSVTTTTTIDDVEMEPLLVEEGSPKKTQTFEEQTYHAVAAPASTETKPTATSTPGKFLTFKEIFFSESPKKVQQIENNKFPDRHSCPRSFSQISGRRSIRPGNDAYTYSYYQNDAHYRESYRRINTELDVTSNTNTSLNVTVGSEVPNNSSFSFFGRGRKRERTPPNVVTQSTVDIDSEISPKSPKRARIDMHGFFSAVASPLTLLRSRFSKTSIQSSTPVKLRLSSKLSAAESGEDEVEVQNVSGISIEEELEPAAVSDTDDTATEDITVGNEADEKKELSSTSSSATHESAINVADSMTTDADAVQQEEKLEKCSTEYCSNEVDCKHDKNSIVESVNIEGGLVGGGDAVVKNKKCSIM